ncbi:MAG: hypothetical protein RSG96_06745, partial [Clostridia bacterium]
HVFHNGQRALKLTDFCKRNKPSDNANRSAVTKNIRIATEAGDSILSLLLFHILPRNLIQLPMPGAPLKISTHFNEC